MIRVKVLVLYGYGINCNYETQRAFERVGAYANQVHVNDLVYNPSLMNKYQIFAIPGGFSFGDDISAGKILAVKMGTYLGDDFRRFLERGLVIGRISLKPKTRSFERVF